MRQSKSRNQKKRDSKGAVVSHSSILIISAFLIGSAAGKAPNPTMRMCLFMLGVFGFVSYFGLGHLAKRRQAGAANRKQQRAVKKLELRVDRHVARSTLIDESGTDGQIDDADCQLVPAIGIQ